MVPNTYTHPSPKPFYPWAQTLSDTYPHMPFTHGTYTDTNLYSHSPMVPNTHTHPLPKPFHPWAQTLSDTHPHMPFTHHPYTDTCPYPISPMAPNTHTHPSPKLFYPWPKYCQTPIPTPALHMAQRQTPIPRPFLPHTHVHTICSSLIVTFCDGLIVMVCGAFNHDDFVMACHSSCNVL